MCLYYKYHLRAFRSSVVLLDTVLKIQEKSFIWASYLDPFHCFHKHNDYTKTRAKKRLNVLKSISSKDCCASALTQDLVLIRPLLENASRVWTQASRMNLEKFERIQKNVPVIYLWLEKCNHGKYLTSLRTALFLLRIGGP